MDTIEIPKKLELVCKQDGNLLLIPAEVLESMGIVALADLIGRHVRAHNRLWLIIDYDRNREMFWAKAVVAS